MYSYVVQTSPWMVILWSVETICSRASALVGAFESETFEADDGDVDATDDMKPGKGESSMATLFAGGLITGESLVGVLLAIPIVVSGDDEVWKLVDNPQQWPTTLFMLMLFGCMAHYAAKR